MCCILGSILMGLVIISMNIKLEKKGENWLSKKFLFCFENVFSLLFREREGGKEGG